MSSVNFSGREVAVKTLSVSDVKDLLDEIRSDASGEQKPPHILDLLFDDDIPAAAVSKATGLSLTELAGNVKPQEARDLIDAVRAQNPFFLGMMERLVGAGRTAVVK